MTDRSNDRITVKDNSLTPTTETDEAAVDAADDDASLRFQLIQNNEAYKSNVNLGRQISKVLDEGIIFEESLTKAAQILLRAISCSATDNRGGQRRASSMATAASASHRK